MKILVIDDHVLFREGLCYVLNRIEGDIEIFEASHYDEAFELLNAHLDIDLILVDLYMPGKDGFSVLETCSDRFPMIPTVVLSASKNEKDMRRAIAVGAMGYIPKDSTSKLMLSAINLVLSGGLYIPPDMATQQKTSTAENNLASLTPRQKEVLALLIEGESNKVIAAELELAEATVKMHVTAILKSLGVNNRTQAAIVAKKQIF